MFSCGWRYRTGPFQLVHREEGQPFCQWYSHMPLKQLPKVLPEPFTHKNINDWVDTTVGVGNHLSHLHGQVQLLTLLTLIGEQNILESRNKYTQIVGGSETDLLYSLLTLYQEAQHLSVTLRRQNFPKAGLFLDNAHLLLRDQWYPPTFLKTQNLELLIRGMTNIVCTENSTEQRELVTTR